MHARFDDLRQAAPRSFRLTGHVSSLVATRADQVPDVLRQAQAEVAAGRWVAGWVSYEAAPAFDRALTVRDTSGSDTETLPLARFEVYTRRGQAGGPPLGDYDVGDWAPEIDRARYADDITAIRARIRAGDTYQVNHTFRMRASFAGEPRGLYGDLCRAQNAAYGAYLDTGDWVVASVSPELFFDWDGERITATPMKGTTARGTQVADDEARREWLASSPKNRAENVMILDMVRNDLSRVAAPGTVAAPALFSTEKYDTVWQLTSTATATTRPGTDLVDVFGAMFPSASITGAPKAAAMAIIAAREVSPRGVYCGAIGFGGPDPSGPDVGDPGSSGRSRWVFNVGIRTVVIDRGQGMARYGTGGGVTYDSTAPDEYAEATLKAAVLSRSSNRYQLLETMRWDPGTGVRRWPEHLRRLSRSAEYFAIPLKLARVQSAVALAIARARPRGSAGIRRPQPGGQDGSLRVRLVLDRDGTPQVTVTALSRPAADPVVLAVDTASVDPADPFMHHKTTQRACYVAAAARHRDCDDVVLVNPTGHVTETTIGNLVVMVDGRWVTPPTSSGCLPGTERAALLAEGVIAEADVTVGQVRSAPALARINSVRGWQTATLRRG